MKENMSHELSPLQAPSTSLSRSLCTFPVSIYGVVCDRVSFFYASATQSYLSFNLTPDIPCSVHQVFSCHLLTKSRLTSLRMILVNADWNAPFTSRRSSSLTEGYLHPPTLEENRLLPPHLVSMLYGGTMEGNRESRSTIKVCMILLLCACI